MNPRPRLAFTCATGILSITLHATIWHADATNGNDTNLGDTRATAFASLQRAIDVAQPGDTVIAYPGIYYEHITVRRGGTVDAPIRIMADQVERDRVIITGAQRNIREKQTSWELVDDKIGLYRVPFTYHPTRVLANRADLLAYPTLADLRAFRFLADDYLGHKHGFAYDSSTKHLYVRLRSDGRYGPTNPNEATMSVSPPTGSGTFGVYPNRSDNYNLRLSFSGSAHIIIDGFTFETPGIAGIRTDASDLTLRNNWFYGCRIGIAAPRSDEPGARNKAQADRVIVEHNYFTQFPAFTDIEDITPAESADQQSRPAWWHKIIHWQRKGTLPLPNQGPGYAYGYEVGAIRGIGDAWEIRYNHFYDMFEALSGGGTGHSSNTSVHHNRFERICDQAVESEPHARNLRIHHNLVIDTFEPFSWAPQAGIPLPGPIIIHDNVILQTPHTQAMLAANAGAVFKLGIKADSYWGKKRMGDIPLNESPAPGGFWATHNTIFVPTGRILTQLNPPHRQLRDFYLLNNILIAHTLSPRTAPSGILYDGNASRLQGGFRSVLSVTDVPTLAATAAGSHGCSFPADTATDKLLIIPDVSPPMTINDVISLTIDSPLRQIGINRETLSSVPDTLPLPKDIPLRPAIGAEPLAMPIGPQSRKANH